MGGGDDDEFVLAEHARAQILVLRRHPFGQREVERAVDEPGLDRFRVVDDQLQFDAGWRRRNSPSTAGSR